MFFLTYSQEILHIVVAFCVLWVSVFVIWLIYYAISTVRDLRKIARGAKNVVQKVDDMTSFLKSKIEGRAANLAIFAEGAKKVIEIFKTSTKKKATSKKTVKTSKKTKK